MTFGSQAYLTQLAAGFLSNPRLTQQAFYPSDIPAGPIAVSPTTHGNGFANTGGLDQDPTTPFGASARVVFTLPGTYHYICLLHPFMRGTIVVR